LRVCLRPRLPRHYACAGSALVSDSFVCMWSKILIESLPPPSSFEGPRLICFIFYLAHLIHLAPHKLSAERSGAGAEAPAGGQKTRGRIEFICTMILILIGREFGSALVLLGSTSAQVSVSSTI